MRRAPSTGRLAGRQQGVTLIVVLVLLLVMLLGGLSMARMSEVGTLVAGNISFKERAVQASEVGINTAFQQVAAMANTDADVGNWYAAQLRATDADGVPLDIDWAAAPEVRVGANNEFSVRYFVDRQCSTTAITEPQRQCLLRQADAPQSAAASKQEDTGYDPPAGRQFRITTRVTFLGRDGRDDVATFVQALVTKK